MALFQPAHTPKILFITLLAIFLGLFVVGRTVQIWLPFWIVGSLGAAAYIIVVAIPLLRDPWAYWRRKGLRGTVESVALITIAAYTLWISQGHLFDELAAL